MKLCLWAKIVFFSVFVLVCNLAQPAEASAFTQAQLKKMSTFLSNFTELGFRNFDIKADGDEDSVHLGAADQVADLIRFGIMHNYVNNYKSRIKACPTQGCTHGSLIIEAKYVAESVKKYFGLPLKHRSVEQSDPPYFYDGKCYHFEGADGEAVYYAEVKQATEHNGLIEMRGELYNTEDKNDRPGTFVAQAKPSKWNGKDTWTIISLKVTNR